MSMAYIRGAYCVPAKRGGMIEFTDSNGSKWRGRILSSRNSRLRVQLDGLKEVSILHPTWNVVYLDCNKPCT